jgi:hypothetical protein
MQKIARTVAHKPARHAEHKHKPRRATAKPTPAKPALQPTVTRVASDVELVAPRGCSASVLIKLVTRDDGHRYYSWWAVVGRHGVDTFSIRYKHNGEDVLRFDLPEGMPLTAEALQPHLASYLASENVQAADPPVIRG